MPVGRPQHGYDKLCKHLAIVHDIVRRQRESKSQYGLISSF